MWTWSLRGKFLRGCRNWWPPTTCRCSPWSTVRVEIWERCANPDGLDMPFVWAQIHSCLTSESLWDERLTTTLTELVFPKLWVCMSLFFMKLKIEMKALKINIPVLFNFSVLLGLFPLLTSRMSSFWETNVVFHFNTFPRGSSEDLQKPQTVTL